MGLNMRILTAAVSCTVLCQVLVACGNNESAISAVEAPNDGPLAVAEQSALAQIWPAITSEVKTDAQLEKKVAELLSRMSSAEKVGQIIQAELKQVTPQDVKDYHLGSILNGGGAFPNNDKYATPADWLATAEAFYQASMDDTDGAVAIPLIWGADAVHGHNNVIGATLFPHNIGLGAARNPDLIERVAAITSAEVQATGLDWIFAPTVATVRDDRWGRTYEGYSEDPEVVKAYARKVVTGMQGKGGTDEFLDDAHVISTVKHFVGDGGTEDGVDRGNNNLSEQALFDVHAQGYVSALEAGVQSVMVSFNSWRGEKMHGSEYLMTQVLKERMGFDGFIIGDWNGHSFVEGCTSVSCPESVNAGLDMFMASEPDWKELYTNTLAQVESGEISATRINDAVTRILRVKIRAGLFDSPPSQRPLAGRNDVIGALAHREVARQAVRESLVLLKNKNALLPIDASANILLAGDGADNIGKQTGGWTISWQGTGNTNEDFPGASSIFDGIKKTAEAAGGQAILSVDGSFDVRPDVAIVVFGENPYAEGHGDIGTLEYQSGSHRDLALLKRLKAQGIPVVSVFLSGRPLWVNAELNASDAFVAAWLPGSEGDGIAEVLLKTAAGEVNHDFKGTLSFSWPNKADQFLLNRGDADYQPLFPYGYGLSYQDIDTLADDLSEQAPIIDRDDLAAYHIFNRTAIAPWALSIVDGENESTSFSGNRVGNSVMSVLAVDKDSQEDSRKVIWSGKGVGAVLLKNGDRTDLTAYLQASAQLRFDVRVHELNESKIAARIECGAGCQADVNLSDELKKRELNQWATITVDLKCFADDGVDFNKIDVPFSLVSQSSAKIAFSNVSYVPSSGGPSDISCS